MDVIFYEGLRICLGCMRSTPRMALLAEAALTDLETRRKTLALRLLSKTAIIHNHPLLLTLLSCRSKLIRLPGFYNNNTSYLLTALQDYFPYLRNIYSGNNFLCFNSEFEVLINSIKTVNLKLSKYELMLKEKFNLATEKFRNNFTFIFSDASRKDDQAGFGISIPALKYKFASRLPQVSICKAEIIAIHDAIQLAINRNISKAIFFSDSSSAIKKLNKNLLAASTDYWSLKTKELLFSVSSHGHDYRLAWIPGHAGIPGNVEADTLANVGRILNIPKTTKLDNCDIYNKIKNGYVSKFKENWKAIVKGKNLQYHKVQNNYPSGKWFLKCSFKNRRHITTIIRMRTGHCLTRLHLFKVKLRNDPLCECGMIEDLNHIFFECPINIIPQFNIYNELIKVNSKSPISIHSILSNTSEQSTELIMKFLRINKIML